MSKRYVYEDFVKDESIPHDLRKLSPLQLLDLGFAHIEKPGGVYFLIVHVPDLIKWSKKQKVPATPETSEVLKTLAKIREAYPTLMGRLAASERHDREDKQLRVMAQSFVSAISKHLQEKGLSVRDLSSKTGYGKRKLERLLSGDKIPSLRMLSKVMSSLDLSVSIEVKQKE